MELADGQRLDQAVAAVSRGLSKAGVELNSDEIRTTLTELGWK